MTLEQKPLKDTLHTPPEDDPSSTTLPRSEEGRDRKKLSRNHRRAIGAGIVFALSALPAGVVAKTVYDMNKSVNEGKLPEASTSGPAVAGDKELRSEQEAGIELTAEESEALRSGDLLKTTEVFNKKLAPKLAKALLDKLKESVDGKPRDLGYITTDESVIRSLTEGSKEMPQPSEPESALNEMYGVTICPAGEPTNVDGYGCETQPSKGMEPGSPLIGVSVNISDVKGDDPVGIKPENTKVLNFHNVAPEITEDGKLILVYTP